MEKKKKGNVPQRRPSGRHDADPVKNTNSSKFKVNILNGLILAMMGIALVFYGAPVWGIIFFAAAAVCMLNSLRYRKDDDETKNS